mmetsp:Transcript_7466/g.11061  ORF Transcript_7466/g.11061 Transcript_7466/m.11061 type:complete len:237 (+) Transcript_7466:65-775(+)
MLLEDVDTDLKVIIVGNGGVGKTTLINKFTTGNYTDTYKKTIGAAFSEKTRYVEELEREVTFMCWDTAGQEEFDSVTKRYYRGAKGCILAFSAVDRASFEAVEKWNDKVVNECGPKVPTVLIQTKVDLAEESNISQDETRALSERLKCKYIACSTKENYGVDSIFDELAVQHFNRIQSGNGDMMELPDTDEQRTDDEGDNDQGGTFTGHKDDNNTFKIGEEPKPPKHKKKTLCSII